jgi:hypothetical protein
MHPPQDVRAGGAGPSSSGAGLIRAARLARPHGGQMNPRPSFLQLDNIREAHGPRRARTFWPARSEASPPAVRRSARAHVHLLVRLTTGRQPTPPSLADEPASDKVMAASGA